MAAISPKNTLHILGGGSIGLLFATSMQKLALRRSTTAGSDGKIPICLLLRSHHRPKIKRCNIGGNSTKYKEYIKSSLYQEYKHNKQETTVTNSLEASCHDDESIHSMLDIPVEILNDNTTTTNASAAEKAHVSNDDSPNSNKNNEFDYLQNILLTTKAPDAKQALKSIIHRLHPHDENTIILMTNGALAVMDELKSLELELQNDNDDNASKRKINWIMACTTHGAHRGHDDNGDKKVPTNADNEDLYHVVHAGLGQTFIEQSSSSASLPASFDTNKLIQNWTQAGMNPTILTKGQMHLLNWKKLATNCAINPLTALRNCVNGDLRPNDSSSSSSIANFGNDCSSSRSHNKVYDYNNGEIMYQIIHEVSLVALAEFEHQYKQQSSLTTQSSSSSILEEAKKELSYDGLVKFIHQVIQSTSKNHSSMLQDVQARRYPTEIEYLNGYVAKIGRDRFGVDMSANEYISDCIRKMTDSETEKASL